MHGGDIYNNDIDIDFSVNLNPYQMRCRDAGCAGEDEAVPFEDAFREGLYNCGTYPDPDQRRLRQAIAQADNIEPDHVFAGCGASELIMASVRSVCPKRVMLPQPCFTGYEHALRAVEGCSIRAYHMKEEEGFALTDLLLDELSEDIDMIVIADPNNPTGKNTDEKVLGNLLERTAKLEIAVILDESFLMISDKYEKIVRAGEMGSKRTQELLKKNKDLYIIRSYTKSFAMPGIRMGYVISCPDNIHKVTGRLPEWNLPALSESVMRKCARISQDSGFYLRSIEIISKERKYMEERLATTGAEVFPGDSTFILFKGPEGLYDKLLDKKILIRKCDDFEGLGRNFYRVAVRSHNDNVKLCDEISSILKRR